MRFYVVQSDHAFRILRGEVIQWPARPSHLLAFPMLQRKSRCVSGTVNSEIFARKESVDRCLLLESDRIEPVNKVTARNWVRAEISALRRNLAKHSLHFAPHWSFTQVAAGHDGFLLQMSISSIFAANGNRFIRVASCSGSAFAERTRMSANAKC